MCTSCKTPLDQSFHADHKQSWKNSGPTITENGQALCPRCNLSKGSKNG
ncbi:MAG: hypothetical protein COW16_02120 [Sphingomonadales bacterium CG12_big_fil_rev_8_21_14_0_65_65_10]|nr:MAG: hypothetical protein COW16_02120 [Sphingomonadales bacterium CG12_big_fil_rev_8_21_14_0_65_65_10]